MNEFNRIYIVLLSICLSVGCTSVDVYPISGSYAKINEMQVLDPMAPENNDGIVNELEGNYGEKVVKDYQNSSSAPAEGKQNAAAESILSSGSGK